MIELSNEKNILVFVVGNGVPGAYIQSMLSKFVNERTYVYTHPKTSGADGILSRVCSDLGVIEVVLEGNIGPEIYKDSDYGIAFSDGSVGTDAIIDFVRGKMIEFNRTLIVVYK
jgi:hypothetical protein